MNAMIKKLKFSFSSSSHCLAVGDQLLFGTQANLHQYQPYPALPCLSAYVRSSTTELENNETRDLEIVDFNEARIGNY
jgi:hypothetical protein